MTVIVPHAPGMLHPVTKFVLEQEGHGIEYAELTGDDGYRLLLQRLWIRFAPVVIVEQDVVPWPGAIAELLACPAAWCTHSYRYDGGIGYAHMLGFAKLSPKLMEAMPDVWSTPCHWSECDRRLFFAARAKSIEPHLHRPAVVHLKGMAA